MAFLPKLKTETINEFLQRLRPTETSRSIGVWIWCINERDMDVNKARVESNEKGAHGEPVRLDLTEGSECNLSDEKGDHGEAVLIDLTVESESDLSDSEIDDNLRGGSLKRGRAVLKKLVEDLRAPPRGRTKKSLREDAVEALKQVAIECGETCGKWMLFPTLAEVDDMWAIVAKATVEGRLGDSAKVCSCKEEVTTLPQSTSKVICVYTSDFQKIDKVKQILESLVELGVPPTSFKLNLFT